MPLEQVRRLGTKGGPECLPDVSYVSAELVHGPVGPGPLAVVSGIGRRDDNAGRTETVGGEDGAIEKEGGDPVVPLPVAGIEHDKYEIESRQEGSANTGIPLDRKLGIVQPSPGIHDGHNGRSGIELAYDPGLGDRYRLLLHGLVYGGPILLLDAPELVDAAHTPVGQNESPGLEGELPVRFLDGGAGEASGGASGASGQDRAGGEGGSEPEELRLSGPRITDQENV